MVGHRRPNSSGSSQGGCRSSTGGGGGRGGTLDMTEDIGDDEYARTS